MSLGLAAGSFLTLLPLLGLYYKFIVVKKPKVFAGDKKLLGFLLDSVPILHEYYSPSPFYFEGRSQSVLSLIVRKTKPARLNYDREILTLKDGGEIALDFSFSSSCKANRDKFLVLILPGLTSSSQTCYVRTLVQNLNKHSEVDVAVFNNRGLGGIPFKNSRTYSASNTEDMEEAIAYLRNKFPERKLIGIGTSLGGMVLAKYLLIHPTEAREIFDTVLLISIAWDCNEGTKNLEEDFLNRHILNKQLTKSLLTLGKRLIQQVDGPYKFDLQKAATATTVREFDAAVTIKQFGFKTVEDYYESATTKGHLCEFSVPVIGINAEDDPMSPKTNIPVEEAKEETSKVALIVTSRGGHLGFLEGFGSKDTHYMERLVTQLVSAIADRETKHSIIS